MELISNDNKTWQSRGYQRLGASSIRLLSIKPGFATEQIECSLVQVADLDEAPPYNALSYVWSKQPNPQPIICNGIELPVSKNLADALKRLRPFPDKGLVAQWPKDHPLYSGRNAWGSFARNRNEYDYNDQDTPTPLFWVDALCINQQDYDERAEQVKLMGKIYARAYKVMIWLKRENTQPLEPSNLVRLGGSGITKHFYLGLYGSMPICLSFIAQALKHAAGGKNRLVAKQPTEDSVHRNLAYGFPLPDAAEWDTLRDLYTNPWFQRVWVVQEAVLANRATALIGDWEIDWSAMGRAAIWFQSKGYAIPAVLKYQIRYHQDFLPVAKAVSVWELCSWPGKKIPLLELLREFRTRSATNPVDKVYATFGLAEELKSVEIDGFHSLVEPSYTKDLVDVYRDIAKFLIIEHGDLSVLSHAGIERIPSFWPSWVPDWRQERAFNELLTSRSARTYNADGDQPLAIGISDRPHSLILQGTQVDTISSYGDRLTSYGFGFVTYQEEIDFVRSAWNARRVTDLRGPYKGQDIAKLFIHALTAGLSNTFKKITDDPDFLIDAIHWFTQHAPNLMPEARIPQRVNWLTKQSPDSGRFHEAFVRTCIDRRFLVTRDGRMGIGPDAMKEDDIIVILFGGKVPYILRPSGEGYRFIGECYVPGLMEGEAVEKWKSDGERATLFELY